MLLLINLSTMAQQKFTEAINSLFFGLDIANEAVDGTLEKFYHAHQLEPPIRPSESRSLSMDSELDFGGIVTRKTFVFKMLVSPYDDLKFESGCIKLVITEAGPIRKIAALEYCLHYNEKANAELAFEKLISIFGPVSTLEKKEEEDFGKWAQFATRKEGRGGIKDIAIFVHGTPAVGSYDVRLVAFKQFTANWP